ncbi:MAG TPA: hypothetical protein VL383_09660 [Gemmatimonadaceae bacterium]|jgi:hypothetical protein|nr:hypothetical protein [Gemmatimonadaceae bacterium]
MRLERWVARSIPLAAAVLTAGASMALAQWGGGQGRQQTNGQELFQWNGRVDREVQIVMRGGNVWTNDIGRTEPGRARSRALSVLPREQGEVSVQVLDGRGDVDVIQQPTSRNGFTSIVRIRDSRGGADNYRIVAYWQGYSNGDVWGRDRGVGRGRNQNGRDGVYRGGNDDDDDRGRQRGGNGQYGTYGRSALHWTGNVDGELEIRIQNGRVDYRTLSGKEPVNVRADRGNLDPGRSDVRLSVAQNQGRGSVTLVQQPSSWNGYTTVIRVSDPQGGYGYYDFDVFGQ